MNFKLDLQIQMNAHIKLARYSVIRRVGFSPSVVATKENKKVSAVEAT